jgi:hypothetical protein
MSASVSYFRSLPVAYRPMVLDQLRSMGGTRFLRVAQRQAAGHAGAARHPAQAGGDRVFQQVLSNASGSRWTSRWSSSAPTTCASSTVA